jgi:hypothetical protein
MEARMDIHHGHFGAGTSTVIVNPEVVLIRVFGSLQCD